MKTFEEFLTEKSLMGKPIMKAYEEGTFGYWWTIVLGNADIMGGSYKGDIVCAGKRLHSLFGAPNVVDGNFICEKNNLTDLEFCPSIVTKTLDCAHNQISVLNKNIKGANTIILAYNKLTSLEGLPKHIEGSLDISKNLLENLRDCTETIGESFDCDSNQLTSLEGAPKEVGSYFSAQSNRIKFSHHDVLDVSSVGGSIYV